MTYTTYRILKLDALECASLEDYIAECGGVCPYYWYTSDGSAGTVIAGLTAIWNIAHGNGFNTLLELTGLGNVAFSRNFGMPLRTVENWKGGVSAPPVWVLEYVEMAVVDFIIGGGR